MATVEECDRAINALAARLGAGGGKHAGGLDRSVSATITDLGLRYRGHLHDGALDDIQPEGDDQPPAQIRLTMSSQELLSLASGELSLGSAWSSGRLKIHASFPDMLRLRAMM